jgi:hypothetical protein
MKSVNFVAGSLGWQISRNGNAEFNNGTFRGSIILLGPAGQFQLTSNPIPAILTAFYAPNVLTTVMLAYTVAGGGNYHYTAWGVIAATGEEIQATGWVSGGAVYEAVLQYLDPTSFVPRTLFFGDGLGSRADGSAFKFLGATAGSSFDPSTSKYSFVDVDGTVDLLCDSISAGRGVRLAVSAAPGVTSTSAGVGNGPESALFSAWPAGNNIDCPPGRSYKMTVTVATANNLGAGFCHYQVNVRSTLSGTLLAAFTDTGIANGHLDDTRTNVFFLKNATASLVSTGVEVSIVKLFSSGAATMTLDSATIVIEDIAGNFDNFVTNFATQVA